MQPFAVDPHDEGAPSRPGFFAPPPLEGSRGGLALIGEGSSASRAARASPSATATSRPGPRWCCTRPSALEGFIGDGLTSDGAQLLYGGGVGIYLAPTWAICPFVDLAAGGLSVIPNQTSFVLKRGDYYVARAGGGILLALRNRILVRIEATQPLGLHARLVQERADVLGRPRRVFLRRER